nr:PREDICTED: AT-rich interactive domain-containing protein 3A-like [Latimeria chalumnae]|eukprot:XP_006011614.2 PREDICTED: AT-rich interactive domain-containing protein 3A-like [Latimeria chalumnae]
MVDNTSIATKSALRAAFSPASSLPLLVSSGSPHSTFVTSQPHQAGGGMKLEAVMENLQRQQAARLALEEKIRKEKEKEFRSMVESQIQQQALAIRQYQAAVRVSSGTGASLPVDSRLEPHRPPLLVPVVHNPELEEVDPANKTRADHPADRDRAMGEDGEDDFDEDMEEDLHEYQPQRPDSGSGHSPKGTLMVMPKVGQAPYALAGQSHSPSSLAQAQTHHHEWTYEEQFKQVRWLSVAFFCLWLADNMKKNKNLWITEGLEEGRHLFITIRSFIFVGEPKLGSETYSAAEMTVRSITAERFYFDSVLLVFRSR